MAAQRAVERYSRCGSERVRGTGSWPGSHVGWIFARRHCGPGQSRRKSTAELGPYHDDDNSGSRSSSGKYAELRRANET